MPRLYVRGGVYYADLGRVNGQRLVVSLKTANKKKASKLFNALATERQFRRLGLDERITKAREPMKFKAAADEYVAYSKAHNKPSSTTRAEVALDVHLRPFFGARLVVELEPRDVESYKAKRLKAKASPATINRELQVLRKIVNHQLRMEALERNPLGAFPLLPVTMSEVPRHLAPEEYEALLGEAKEPLRTMIIVAAQTGLRRGEIFNLTWDRVDLKTPALLVDADTASGWSSKTRKARRIPINELAAKALKAYQARSRLKSRYVFCNRQGGRLGTIKTAWRTACREAKVKARFQDLRHSCASWAIQEGVSEKAVQELLGHADPRMTRRYSHLAPVHLQEAVERIAKGSKRRQNGDTGQNAPTSRKR